MQLYYATAHPRAHPASLLRFDTEQDRDEFVSRNPAERRLADRPADTSGFRVAVADTSTARPLCCGIKALPEDENDRVVKSTLIHAATLGKQGQYDEADALIRVAKELLMTTHMGLPVEVSENRRKRVREFMEENLGTEPYDETELMELGRPEATVARFAETLKPVPDGGFSTEQSEELLTIARLLAFTDCPPSVLREHTREMLMSHGLVTPGESSGQTP